MKTFDCGDVMIGCTARFVCVTDEELVAAVAAHTARDHPHHPFSFELRRRVLAAAHTS